MWEKNYSKICLFLCAFNIILASWYFVSGDLYFHSDIGRDFLLLDEIAQKGYILIGPRTGADGVYHGVFWYFLNFPVFLLSHGNPVAVEGFWILLTIAFLFGGFKIARDLFFEKAGYFFIVLSSLYLIYRLNTYSHPDGAFLFSLFFFYTFWKYIKTYNFWYLVLNVLISGLLIHLEFVIGWPLFILSVPFVLVVSYRAHKLKHFLAFFLILVPLSTYIVFELRHNFFEIRSLSTFIMQSKWHGESYIKIIINRFDYMLGQGIQFVSDLTINKIVNLFFFAVLFKLIYKGENRRIYLTFLYFFFGFFVFSLIIPYFLLRHHFVTFMPVVILIFSSVLVSKAGKVLLPLFLFLVFYAEIGGIAYVFDSKDFIGKNQDSWQGLNKVATDAFVDTTGEFGYFVFSPDKLGYQANYAMIYRNRVDGKKRAFRFEKKPITYVIAAPLPIGINPNANDVWWIKSGINIKNEPEMVWKYENGYKLYKFKLTESEVAVPFSELEDLGIHFR